ncbi:TIGR02677 family protein [Clostridium sp. MSJ-8]|uniref:TIGR02677 family protein n=1 Tax=Clostridium sp. MSJ-8 TaxID=2841510 RepID=UPI001C0EF854|nr:TIGR02677 family protein [Clostridium sp. MSJ-8]MBU5487840.1 TIGR02677 family protein [Clostridium sp. MSJ-8]
MSINYKVRKKFEEAKYLSVENAERYRVILRLAYEEYEQMKFWFYKEDIYELITNIEGFEEYTLDNLKQDLDSLEEWGNLITVQDASRVKTLEEFKNRRYKYQISSNTIELERTLIAIENINETSRGSLEISLIENFRDKLLCIKEIDMQDNQKVYSWWMNLSEEFRRLNENYKDYISKFYSPKTEVILKTTEFLLFKENFIRYLRQFVKGLQTYVPYIKEIFEKMDEQIIVQLINNVIEYEKKINNIDSSSYDEENEFRIMYGMYDNMKNWFIGTNKKEAMIDSLLENTNEIIRKITTYALQIIEMNSLGGNRKEEYKTIINLFNKCEDIDEAHKLSSVVFGVLNSRHIVCNIDRETESINSSIFEEKPTKVIVKPRNRYREKTASRSPIRDKSAEKEKIRKEILKKREREQELLESRIKDNKLVFASLQDISREERNIFLKWLSVGLNSNGAWTKNEYGRYYKVDITNKDKNIVISCQDGDFIMPEYELIFKEK